MNIENEAYYGFDDPASFGCKGRKRYSVLMWEEPRRTLHLQF